MKLLLSQPYKFECFFFKTTLNISDSVAWIKKNCFFVLFCFVFLKQTSYQVNLNYIIKEFLFVENFIFGFGSQINDWVVLQPPRVSKQKHQTRFHRKIFLEFQIVRKLTPGLPRQNLKIKIKMTIPVKTKSTLGNWWLRVETQNPVWSWVWIPTGETIVHAPFIWIKTLDNISVEISNPALLLVLCNP